MKYNRRNKLKHNLFILLKLLEGKETTFLNNDIKSSLQFSQGIVKIYYNFH